MTFVCGERKWSLIWSLWSVDVPFMNYEDSEELRRRLAAMDHGDAPEDFVPAWARAACCSQQPQLAVCPSVEEMEAALHSNVDEMSSEDCLRALVKQNNVLLRDAIWRRQHMATIGSSSGRSGSLRSSLTTTGSSSGGLSSESSGCNSPLTNKKLSPPKAFECPICHHCFNEKDFDRHILAWISKVGKTGPVRPDHCAGIRDSEHPLLHRYPHGTLAERVQCVVTNIRSLLHPGAYDALSADGSGRQHIVAARFAFLFG